MSNPLVEQLFVMAERQHSFDQGAYLFHRDDAVELMFVVKTGAVELVRPQADGKPLILQRAEQSSIVAEASLYSPSYHCDAVTTLPSILASLSTRTFLQRLREDADFSLMWSSHLATQMQRARQRSEILARKTVAERLEAWLSLNGGRPPQKGEWKRIAEQIGVSPEALYRERAKRR